MYVVSRIIQVWKSELYKNPVSVQNFWLKSYFGVFTHWIMCKFDITLYLAERYNVFVGFKWEIPVGCMYLKNFLRIKARKIRKMAFFVLLILVQLQNEH